MRTFYDRIVLQKDKEWFQKAMHNIVVKRYDLVLSAFLHTQDLEKEPFPVKNPEQLYFSIFNPEIEGYYVEHEVSEQVSIIIEMYILKYNESKDRVRLDLVLYRYFNEQLLKIHRVVKQLGGHALIIAHKGSGVAALTRIAAYVQNAWYKEMTLMPNYSHEDWKNDLKRLILSAGLEGRATVLAINEYRLTQPEWRRDLACLISNGQVPHYFQKEEQDGLAAEIDLRAKTGPPGKQPRFKETVENEEGGKEEK